MWGEAKQKVEFIVKIRSWSRSNEIKKTGRNPSRSNYRLKLL